MRRFLGVVVSIALLFGASVAVQAAEVTVLAAASLTDALGQIDGLLQQLSHLRAGSRFSNGGGGDHAAGNAGGA